jgi:hypothetical protein
MACMKTTLEIPDDLFREAKSQAALRGAKLKDLVADGLRLVLSGAASPATRRTRVKFPLIRSTRSGTMKLTGERIAEIEAQQEAEVYGKFMRR